MYIMSNISKKAKITYWILSIYNAKNALKNKELSLKVGQMEIYTHSQNWTQVNNTMCSIC